MAGKVTVGLTSHWPCVSGISSYRLNGLREGVEHPAYAPWSAALLLLPIRGLHA